MQNIQPTDRRGKPQAWYQLCTMQLWSIWEGKQNVGVCLCSVSWSWSRLRKSCIASRQSSRVWEALWPRETHTPCNSETPSPHSRTSSTTHTGRRCVPHTHTFVFKLIITRREVSVQKKKLTRIHISLFILSYIHPPTHTKHFKQRRFNSLSPTSHLILRTNTQTYPHTIIVVSLSHTNWSSSLTGWTVEWEMLNMVLWCRQPVKRL